MRRITNFSTGDLGVRLANRLAGAGFAVICFKGTGATCTRELEGAELRAFTTNDDLRQALESLPDRADVRAVFHAAALCDFRVQRAEGSAGALLDAKISSRAGTVTLTLEPAPKLIAELRALFPKAALAGWKYELDGRREEAVAKGWQQIEENGTDLCLVNGAAYGSGFGACERNATRVRDLATKDALCDWLVAWLGPMRERD